MVDPGFSQAEDALHVIVEIGEEGQQPGGWQAEGRRSNVVDLSEIDLGEEPVGPSTRRRMFPVRPWSIHRKISATAVA